MGHSNSDYAMQACNVAQTQVTNDENNKSVDDNSQVNCNNKQSQISTINMCTNR